MKQVQKITTVLLAALIMVGTTGFTVEKFYCGTYLKSIHVFTSPTPCCIKTNTLEGKCRTETEYIKAEIASDLPVLSHSLAYPAISSILLSKLSSVSIPSQKIVLVKYLNYKPPLVLRDIQVLVQSFLI
ncbi:MAG: hypothetical protein JKY42_07525 [Flavobacteriales bacterium]|nr:hypothetical protein [Flavobacteriales bacterium]